MLMPWLFALALTTVRFEEPTGIERRYAEIVSVPAGKPCRVLDPEGKEVPVQHTGSELLFPVSVMPGQLPAYQMDCEARPAALPVNELVARRIGTNRVELANSRFRMVIDLAAAAIVEAYNLTAGPLRMLNIAETTPPDGGWTTAGTGPLTGVEFLETGPLRARVRIGRGDDQWEFSFAAGSPTVRWRARKAFRFHAVSALPYAPFDRFVTGEDVAWPDGPDDSEPPDHEVAVHQVPSGVYYQARENYGAFGVGGKLAWSGLGSARFASSDGGEALLVFGHWKGNRTALDFRRELRIAEHPILRAASLPAFRTPAPEGEWQLAWGEKGAGPTSEWRTVQVPGAVQTQWLPKDDWYSRRAEWVSEKEWWYRTRLPAPKGNSDHVRLAFEATDYYADTWWNGVYLGRHEGYIDPYEYDVTPHLKADNELVVRVWTPVSYYWRHRPYTIKGSYGAVDQKPDKITPLGITRPVRLVRSGAVYIRDIAVNTVLNEDGSATVAVEQELSSASAGVKTRLMLRPKNFSASETWNETATGTKAAVRVASPRLWWTWDHGKPNLYELRVELLDAQGRTLDQRTQAVGIREIEKIGWTFYLNHKRLFIRGTNYYYGNLYMSLMDRAAYERDMKWMLGMNVNMIRLHCHYANPEFYDLADEAGVLIWQDYLEAWYPEDRDFSLRAAELYGNHIRYVRNHTSVAVWATSDEESLENYRDLTKHLAPRLALLDPQHRPVVRSTGRYGDAHVYHGWYDGNIWDYTKMDEEFVSELGATALPNHDSLVKFLPAAWPIRDHLDDWVFHKLQITEAMRAWGEPGAKSLREYIPQTQDYVARLFQIALERSRIRRYHHAGGILHFHAIDFWPSVTMAAVDYYRTPTKVYDVVRNSFAPVGVLFEYEQDRWPEGEAVDVGMWLVNDTWEAVERANVKWRAEQEGTLVREGEFEVSLGADGITKLGIVRLTDLPAGSLVLRTEVINASGRPISRNSFEFKVTRRNKQY